MSFSEAFNRDCMDAMREFPDKFFDLAVVDPPYGDGHGGSGAFRYGGMFQASISGAPTREKRSVERRGGKWAEKYGKKIVSWDVAPDKEYFDELFRVSRNQIIWGGNYFMLPPTRCFVVYRKTNIPEQGFSMVAVEYAWTSFDRNAEIIEAFSQSRPGEERFHPTQKPVKLYREVFNRFARPGDKILDTHLGSGSSRIAAYDAGLDFWGYEIDPEYFAKEEKRFEEHAAQMNLFLEEGT